MCHLQVPGVSLCPQALLACLRLFAGLLETSLSLNKENNVFKDGIGVQGLRFKVVKFDSLGLGTC